MKMLRKYATMAFLFVSVATIMPMDRNFFDNKQTEDKQKTKPKQEKPSVELNKTQTPWYKEEYTMTTGRFLANIAVYSSFAAFMVFMLCQENQIHGIRKS